LGLVDLLKLVTTRSPYIESLKVVFWI